MSYNKYDISFLVKEVTQRLHFTIIYIILIANVSIKFNS